jgi:hypothetical protein
VLLFLECCCRSGNSLWGLWVGGFRVAQQEIWLMVHPAAPDFHACEAVIAQPSIKINAKAYLRLLSEGLKLKP